MARDGNIRFQLFEKLVEIVAAQRLDGLSPDVIRRYFRRRTVQLASVLEPLVPYYELAPPEELAKPTARTDANIAAMQLLAEIEGGAKIGARQINRVLGRFSGWGGLSLERVAHELPYAQDSLGLAHEWYTPTALTDAVAECLQPYLADLADSRGRIKALEPSAGVGRLIGSLNRKTVRHSILWHGVELNEVAARILRLLHPQTDVFEGPFERFNAEQPDHQGTWKLVVANPPFGSSAAIREYATEDPDLEYREKFDYAYFLRRSLDALAIGGIGVFIVPNSFMTGASTRSLRTKLLLSHHLMGAFRIPSEDAKGRDTFPSQATVTDVVFFRSRGGVLGALDDADRYIAAGEYFNTHPDHLLGTEIEAGAPTATGGRQFRYAVVGEFRGLPDLEERPSCTACVLPSRPVARKARQSALVRRQLDTDDPALGRAVALGTRITKYLALASRSELEDAGAHWREIHDSAVDLAQAYGNPWEWTDLVSLSRRDDAGAQGLLRAFEKDGSLVDALRTPPKDSGPYRGPEDPEAQAEWLYGRDRQLTIDELHTFHAKRGGTLARAALVEQLLDAGWFLDGPMWESLVPRDEYLSGDLWAKYDRAVARDDARSAAQAELLLQRIEPATFADLTEVSPRQTWVPLDLVATWLGTSINSSFGKPELTRADGLTSAESGTLSQEASWFLGWVNHSLSVFSPRDIDISDFEGLPIPEAIKAEIKKSAELGERESIDVRRFLYGLKWETSFHQWVGEAESRRAQLTDAYNRIFRGDVPPTFDSSPIKIVRWTTDPKLQLKPHQIRAVKARAATRGGILGFDVGVGKTFTSLAIVAWGRQKGWIRRPAIVVPAGIVWQWRSEIRKVLPDYRVLVVGKKYQSDTADAPEDRAAKWTEWQAGHYDLVLITDTALGKTKVDADDVSEYAGRRTAIMRSLRLAQAFAKTRKERKRTERQRSLLKSGVTAWVKQTLRQETSVYDPGLAWGDLGIDFLVYDEMGNIRNTWGPSPREFGVPKYMGSVKDGSWRAWQADFRAGMVRKYTGGRGILGLTGTLGENSPIEIYNAFQFVDPTIFERVGIMDPEQFVDRYLDITSQRVRAITGEAQVRLAVVGFKNLRELRRILFRWGSFVSAKQANLRLPESRECQAQVDLSTAQEDVYEVLRVQARTALKKRNTGSAFAAISKMRLVTVHPELIKGYTWSTANGGRASREVTQKALPFWVERGWELRKDRFEREIATSTNPELQQRLRGKIAKLDAKAKKSDKYVLEKLLAPPDKMTSPKFEACAKRVIANPGCGHIIFSQMTATHYWLREVLVKAGIPRDRIAIINGDVGDITEVSKGFNGSDEKAPIFDVVIANSKAYRGANLQRRTCSVHNVDLTWTPADLEQRRGRADRQGNTEPVLQIWFYFARHSFDGFQFSLVAGKAKWQDALYRSDGDRSINPAAQLDLDEGQLLRLTAASEEEAEQLDRELQAEAERRDQSKGHANALRLMRAAAERFHQIREGSISPARRRTLKEEADERLRTLAALGNDIWPWKRFQDRARTQDLLVGASIEELPLFEGLRAANVHIGRVAWVGRAAGVREFGSPTWSAVQEPSYRGIEWTEDEVRRDADETARELEVMLDEGAVSWEELKWGLADDEWLRSAWDRYGDRVIKLVATQSLRVPILDDGGLRLASGRDLAANAGRVIPPTRSGWEFFQGAALRSTLKARDARDVARSWFLRTYKRGEVAQRERVELEGGPAPVECPASVYALRPPHLVDQLVPLWEGLDREKWSADSFAVELSTFDDRAVSVDVMYAEPPNEAEFVRGVIQALFNNHMASVHDVETASVALVNETDPARWLDYGRARTVAYEAFRELESIVGSEAASAMDLCARRMASRTPRLTPAEGIAEILARYARQSPGWYDDPSVITAARQEVKRWLARTGTPEPAKKAEEGVAQAIERARAGVAPQAAAESEATEATEAEVDVDTLPPPVVKVLKNLGVRGGVVTMSSARVESLMVVGGRGKQGSVALIDLASGSVERHVGSFGGPNPFSSSPVDKRDSKVDLTESTVLVKAVTGGGKKPYAYIIVHPVLFAKLRPSVSADNLSVGEALALSIILGFTSAGRRSEFGREGLGHYSPQNPYIKGLVRAGLIKIVGQSVRVTKDGKLLRSALESRSLSRRFAAERRQAEATAQATAEDSEQLAEESKRTAPSPTAAKEKKKTRRTRRGEPSSQPAASANVESPMVSITVGNYTTSIPVSQIGGHNVV